MKSPLSFLSDASYSIVLQFQALHKGPASETARKEFQIFSGE